MKRGKKIIQDPVHGCITLRGEFVKALNSVQFQRLKQINQSSFRVLYPGATHDRFLHSIGTYYLGEKAVNHFFENIKSDISDYSDKIETETEKKLENTFLYASLLHDVGHAPFSHTCEGFFKVSENECNQPKIYADLIKAVKELADEFLISRRVAEEFEEDFLACIQKKDQVNKTIPSPHEVLSATMLIKERKQFWDDDENEINYELACRAVIGVEYRTFNGENKDVDYERRIRNCLIRLLNSPCLDVDKLDYICRDTKMTGFSNVQLDIERITTAITAVCDNDVCELAFRKNMLSVIENVFRAKIEQGLWLISHPVVVYENDLIERCVKYIEKIETSEMQRYVERIFSYEALTEQGVIYRERNYRLLSDVDLVSDFKHFWNTERDCVFNEYFNRGMRRKPLWKSYKEYLYFFNNGNSEDVKKYPRKVYEYFDKLVTYLSENKDVLNNETYMKLQQKAKDEPEKYSDILEVAELLRQLCSESKVAFDLVLIKVKNDFANKISTDNVQIKFVGEGKDALIPYKLLQENSESKSIPFFYIYSKQSFDRDLFKKMVLDKVRE